MSQATPATVEQHSRGVVSSILNPAEEKEFQGWLEGRTWEETEFLDWLHRGMVPAEASDALRGYWKNQALPRQGVKRYSGEGMDPEDYDPEEDDYGEMVKAGFTHKEVREYLGPRLAAAGFTDTEIHEHFRQQAEPSISYGRAAELGFQESWTGLKYRNKLPDELQSEEMESLGIGKRLVMQATTLAGDIPPMASGLAMGAATGPAAPIAMPTLAFAMAEGAKAQARDAIINGPMRPLEDPVGTLRRGGHIVHKAAKGGAIGAVTGGAGSVALGAAAKAGLGAAGQTAAKLGAEVFAMPVTAAGLEGRIPSAQEFADAAVLIAALHVGGSALGTSGRTVMRTARDIAPKLEEITARTGKTPMEVVKEAEADPTVKQDILSTNRDMPGKFAEDTLNRLKAGEEVPTEELRGYENLSWAQAAINERAGTEAIQAKLGELAEKAVAGSPAKESLHWAFIRSEEAAALSQKTGTEITPGFTHVVDVSALRHAIKEHGNPATEIPRGQLPITAEDLARIPEVIRDHDAVVHAGKNKIGRDVIRYEKTLNTETVMVVEEVRAKRNHLAFQTMYKKKATDAAPPSLTSETLRGMNTTSNAEANTNGLSKTDNIPSGPKVKPMEEYPQPVVDAMAEEHMRRAAGEAYEPLPDLQTLETMSAEEFYRFQDRQFSEELAWEWAKSADNPVNHLRGRIDGSALKSDWPGAYQEIVRNYGPGFFKAKAKGGIPIDYLTDELVQRGVVPRHATTDDLVELLKSPKDNLRGFAWARRTSRTAVPVDPNKPAIPQITSSDAVKMSDIVAMLGDELGIPIRTGGFLERALGIYKQTPEVIRVKTANDIATIVHEAGHHLQNTLFGTIEAKPLVPFRDELAPMATKPRSGQSPLPEGFAEFVAKYVVNPTEAKTMAPRFYDHFENLLDQNAPRLKQVLLQARDGVKKWAEQPSVLEVLSHISIEGKKPGLFERIASPQTWERLYTNFVDRLFPLQKAAKLLAAGEELPAHMNPYTLARTFAGAKGKAAHFIERSPFKFDTWQNVGKPLAETLRAVENMDEFRAYLVARRGLEIEAMGKKAGPRPEAIRATADALRGKYEPLAKELGEYQDHLVNYLVDAGLVSPESASAMREMNKQYIPFFRVMESDGGVSGGGKSLQGKNPFKRLKGSGRDIVDPIESIIKNTYAYIEAAEKNAIARAFTELADRKGAGWLVEEVPMPKEAVKISVAEANKAFLDSLDTATRQMLEPVLGSDGMDGVVTFWRNAQRIDKKNQIEAYRDGKRTLYQVAPEIAEVMHDLRAETIPLFVKLMAIPSRMLRAGATLTPDFMVRNLIRDAVDAGVVSRSGFIPGVDTARGLKRALTKDETYWNWMKAGGSQASMVSMDRTSLQKTLKDITATGYTEKVWNLVKNPVEGLRAASELSEHTTRLGEFGKAARQHGTDKAGLMQSAYESREIIDFARRGRLTANFNMMTAFFNAQLQGLDRMGRGFGENPKRFLVRAALYIGVPSVLLAVKNHGDRDVAEVPRAQRDMFWIVPVGEGKDKALLRIPKPFENGILFGSTLERATEFILDAYTKKHNGDINKAREEAFRGLGKSILDAALPGVVPTLAIPFVEQFANRSIVFDRPIIPKDRESMLPEYQYAPYTTELARMLSRLAGTLPPVGEMNTFSPARAENYIRAWTGGLGMYVMQAVDYMGRKAGALPDPVKPAGTLADMPFVKAFIARHPSMGAESIQRFYDQYGEAQKYLKTINGLQKDFKYDDIANLLPYAAYKAIEGPRQALSGITKTIDLIHKDSSMSADEKRQLVDAAYFQAIEVSRLGNQAFELLKKDIKALKERAAKEGQKQEIRP